MLLLYTLLLLFGFVALIKGAGWFVDGSSALARNFKVPGLIIGLTIVALGTSSPELAVSISAAIQGSNEIALSNVVGSNIFNLLCVLGICAIIHTVPTDKGILKRDFPLSIGATILVLLVTCFGALPSGNYPQMDQIPYSAGSYPQIQDSLLHGNMNEIVGMVNRTAGIVMFTVFLVYILYLIYDTRKNPDNSETQECLPLWKCFLLITVGLVLIIGGGQAVVYSAKEIAQTVGMSETLIGLTIVAVGTSLPELVTSVVAAKKGETGLAVGNAVGSNIFNLLLILGLSAAIHPITVNAASVYDILILIAASIITYVFLLTRKSLKRSEGIIMVSLYLAEVLFAILRTFA